MENMLRIMVLIVIVATVASFPFHHLKKREVGHEEKRNTHSPVDIELMRYMITMVRDIFTYYNIPSDGGVTVHQLADYYRRAGANNEVATKLSRDSMILIHDRPTGFLTQAVIWRPVFIGGRDNPVTLYPGRDHRPSDSKLANFLTKSS